jgi:hypothetical protein
VHNFSHRLANQCNPHTKETGMSYIEHRNAMRAELFDSLGWHGIILWVLGILLFFFLIAVVMMKIDKYKNRNKKRYVRDTDASENLRRLRAIEKEKGTKPVVEDRDEVSEYTRLVEAEKANWQ